MKLPRVVYVCSAARCGSTVLDMFLGSHSAVASLGEINLVGKALALRQTCTCGLPLPDCGAWRAVWACLRTQTGHDMREDPYALRLWDARARVVVDRAHQTPAFERAVRLRSGYLALRAALPEPIGRRMGLPRVLDDALEAKLALYAAVSACWDRPVVVDSSKNPWEAIELARRAPDRVHVVLLTRDGRGVFHSRRSSGFSRQESVSGWRRYYGRTASLLRAKLAADRLVELHYESFAENPEATGRRLSEVLGIDYESTMPRLEATQRHMVNGNDTRFKPHDGVRLDERWRRELAAEELTWFERRAGNLNRSLGYL